MGNFALLKDGWIDGVVMTECGFNPQDYSAVDYVELKEEDVHKIKESQLTMFWDGNKFCQIKNPKAIWKRIRAANFQGQFCADTVKSHIAAIDDTYPDISGSLAIDGIKEVKKVNDPLFEKEFQPGLRISLATDADLNTWEAEMIRSELFTEDEAWIKAANWLSNEDTWCIKTVWKNKILQIETYHFGKDGNVSAGFTSHLDRGRPIWFWRQMAKPVFNALYAHGFEVIRTSIRKDRQDWVDHLKEAYGAEELKQTDIGIHLRYKIKDSLSLIGEWPIRRTLGSDWKWEKNGVLIREVQQNDFPDIRRELNSSWGESPRKDFALRVLNDRYELDNAQILLAFVDGKIIEGKTIREKEPTMSSITQILAYDQNDSYHTDAYVGFLQWQKDAGYKESSFTIETAQVHEMVKPIWASRGWKLQTDKAGVTEYRSNIDKELNDRK
jgi:hypothetical protein